MVELVTRMMEFKKQQARARRKQSPSARQLLGGKSGTQYILGNRKRVKGCCIGAGVTTFI